MLGQGLKVVICHQRPLRETMMELNTVRGQPGFPEKYKTFRSTEQREQKVDVSGGGSGMGQIILEIILLKIL
jgi:hypothetical protein